MYKFVVYVHWSQTDWDYYLVNADNKKDAEKIAREKLGGEFWIMGVMKISKELN